MGDIFFHFDIVIPATEADAARDAMTESLGRSGFTTYREYLADLLEPDERASFCEVFELVWEDSYAKEADPTPLEALARDILPGDVVVRCCAVAGYWFNPPWEEPLMDAIAPYVKAGGSVVVEDNGRIIEWRFDGKVRHTTVLT